MRIMARMKKGSKEAKAWGKRMRSLRKGGKRKTYKPRKGIEARGKSMPRRRYSRKKGRGKRDNRLPLLPIIGLAQNLVRPTPSGRTLIDDIKNMDVGAIMYDGRELFLGIDNVGQFHADWVVNAYVPVILGALGSKVMTAVGVNKAMRKIPLVGSRIKL